MGWVLGIALVIGYLVIHTRYFTLPNAGVGNRTSHKVA